MLDHRQKYALEMAVYELVNAVQSTRETPSRWINVESVLETIEDIRSAFTEMEGRIDPVDSGYADINVRGEL